MFQLRPYQDDGVGEIRNSYIEGYEAPLYILPTGGGKTVIFNFVARNSASKSKRVLILMHRVELIRQTIKKLQEDGIIPGVINPKFTPNPLAPIQVGSVQTIWRRTERMQPPDLIIIDEAHHATASTYTKIIEAFPNAKILGVTATPERTDGTGLGVNAGGHFDTMIMGPQIYELIQEGYLVQPKHYMPSNSIDFSSFHHRMGDFVKSELEDAFDKPHITGDAVSHYRKLAYGKPAVAFCVSISHAEHVAKEFRNAGYRSWSVDGKTDERKRQWLINGLGNGKVDVLTSCDLIGEGVDIPSIFACINLRPTESLSLYIQQGGRALRPIYAPGYDLSTKEGRLASIAASEKPHAIILDHAGNALRHGLLDEHRPWTLDGKKKSSYSGASKEGENVRVLQCEKCYNVHKPLPFCPACGHKYAIQSREVEVKEGTLKEISEQEKVALKRQRMKEQGQANSYDALAELGKKRGYKPGWAKHIAKARGYDVPKKTK